MAELNLSPDERALIEERRKQQAQAELKAREDAALPDILSMGPAEYNALSPQKRAAMWRYATEAAQQR